MKIRILLGAALFGLCGCATHTTVESAPMVIGQNQTGPGVVDSIWEEPMVDVIEVPPGLDPEGMYYRPAHQEVIEIRQGRWRYDHTK